MRFFLLLGWFACTCADSSPSTAQSVWVEVPEFKGVEHAFKGANSEALPSLKHLEGVRKACPVLERASFSPDGDQHGRLRIIGSGLDAVRVLAAHDGSGSLHESVPHLEADGSLRFALGCRQCRLVLGFELEGRTLGCLGPGYSLRLGPEGLVSE